MLLADHVYNNPIAVVFTKLLLQNRSASLDDTLSISYTKPEMIMKKNDSLSSSSPPLKSISSSDTIVKSSIHDDDNEDVKEKGLSSSFNKRNESVMKTMTGGMVISKRNRNRWTLAVTLINNPVLRKLRRPHEMEIQVVMKNEKKKES